MSVSRRSFIKSGAMAAVAAGFLLESPALTSAQKRVKSGPWKNYFEIPAEARQAPFFHYKRATFEPLVGDIFTTHDAIGRVIQLKLDRVVGYAPAPATRITTATRRETESFSLLFEAESPLPPFSSIHVIEHPALGRFDLFLNRSDVRRRIYYQAIINNVV